MKCPQRAKTKSIIHQTESNPPHLTLLNLIRQLAFWQELSSAGSTASGCGLPRRWPALALQDERPSHALHQSGCGGYTSHSRSSCTRPYWPAAKNRVATVKWNLEKAGQVTAGHQCTETALAISYKWNPSRMWHSRKSHFWASRYEVSKN